MGNDDDTARALRFYEPFNPGAASVFPSTAKYVALKAGAMSADVTFTLPISDGSTGQYLKTDGAGNLAFQTAAGGVVSGSVDNAALRADGTGGATSQGSAIVISDYTASTQNNAGITADDGSTANIGLFLSPKGTGALTAQRPDGTATGGNARGVHSVDFQILRSAANQVASGIRSVIIGGEDNKVETTCSFVAGYANYITGGSYANINGGRNNLIAGGAANTNVIAGGQNNQITAGGGYCAIFGGESLTLNGALRSGGFLSGVSSGTGSAMSITANDTIVFGNNNLWLANNNNTASQIRFYEPYNTTGAFPNTANFVGLKAPALSADVTFTLPTADGSSGQYLKTDGAGNLAFQTAAGAGDMLKSENLSGLANATTARANLGIITARLTADRTIASTTATKVTDLDKTLAAGTYRFEYYLLAQSATGSVSPTFGVNFSGTAAVANFYLRYPSTGTTASTGVADNVGSTAGQMLEAVAQNAYSTTTPNLLAAGGVAVGSSNILYIIEGLVVVTVSGDLQLYHGSETASNTTLKADSSLIITKI